MIKADHKQSPRLLFNFYIDPQFRKYFSKFTVIGSLPEGYKNAPLVITPNHISWWDGFFIDRLNREIFGKKFYILMLEEQLKKYNFFKKLGAFSIVQGNGRSTLETKRYIDNILKDPETMLVIYPQGEIEPQDTRPLDLKPGISLLLRDAPDETIILPAGFRIEYAEQKLPGIFARFGEKRVKADIVNDLEKYFAEFVSNLDMLAGQHKDRKSVYDVF